MWEAGSSQYRPPLQAWRVSDSGHREVLWQRCDVHPPGHATAYGLRAGQLLRFSKVQRQALAAFAPGYASGERAFCHSLENDVLRPCGGFWIECVVSCSSVLPQWE